MASSSIEGELHAAVVELGAALVASHKAFEIYCVESAKGRDETKLLEDRAKAGARLGRARATLEALLLREVREGRL